MFFFKTKIEGMQFGEGIAAKVGQLIPEVIWKAENIAAGFSLQPGSFNPTNSDFGYERFGYVWLAALGDVFAKTVHDKHLGKIVQGYESLVIKFIDKYSLTDFAEKIRPSLSAAVENDVNKGDLRFEEVGRLLYQQRRSRKKLNKQTIDTILSTLAYEFNTAHRLTMHLYRECRIV